MAFWTKQDNEPLRKFRFQVTLGEVLWYAKSVSKPSFEVSTNEYQLINHKFKYPGVLTWNDVEIVITDEKEEKKEDKYYKKLLDIGYNPEGTVFDGINKTQYKNGDILIEQLDADGRVLEEWKLINPFIKSVNFGSLDYSSDDLVEITLSVAYDSATLS